MNAIQIRVDQETGHASPFERAFQSGDSGGRFARLGDGWMNEKHSAHGIMIGRKNDVSK